MVVAERRTAAGEDRIQYTLRRLATGETVKTTDPEREHPVSTTARLQRSRTSSILRDAVQHRADGSSESGSGRVSACTIIRRMNRFAAVALGAVVVWATVTVRTQQPASQTAVVKQYCVGCHNDRTKAGQLTLAAFDVADPGHNAEVAEKMIRKLRAGLMPPPGSRRPDEAVLAELADTLTAQADAHPIDVPGGRTFQRLN